MSNQTLESLNLYFNEIGNLGCSAFGEAKANGSRLKRLNMNMNNIGDDGLIKLANGLKSNTSLVELNLSGNNIKRNGALALSRVLEDENITLETLTLLTQLTKDAIDALRAGNPKISYHHGTANRATKLLTKSQREGQAENVALL